MEQRQYIIGINYDEQLDVDDSTQATREQFVIDNQQQNEIFQGRLNQWLIDEGFDDEVDHFDETLMFPILRVKCSPKAADKIEQYPGVDFVRPDGFSI